MKPKRAAGPSPGTAPPGLMMAGQKGIVMAEIKTWAVTYRHPVTGQLVKGHEFAATKSEALRKAREANPECDVPGKHWIVVSAEEVIY